MSAASRMRPATDDSGAGKRYSRHSRTRSAGCRHEDLSSFRGAASRPECTADPDWMLPALSEGGRAVRARAPTLHIQLDIEVGAY
jgi:hypothetical protein